MISTLDRRQAIALIEEAVAAATKLFHARGYLARSEYQQLLARGSIERDEIDTIILSHFHADHFGGIPLFLLGALHQDRRRKPLQIAGPPQVEERVRQIETQAKRHLLRLIRPHLSSPARRPRPAPDDDALLKRASVMRTCAPRRANKSARKLPGFTCYQR